MKNTTKREAIGLIFGIIACVLFWLPYSYTATFLIFSTTRKLCLIPNLLTGMLASFFTLLLYVRGFIRYDKIHFHVFSIIMNIALLATLFEIVLSPGKEPATFAILKNSTKVTAIIAFAIAVLFFGVQEIAKIVCLLLLIAIFFLKVKLVSDAMGIVGFVALLCLVLSFSLQGSFDRKSLNKDIQYLLKRPF